MARTNFDENGGYHGGRVNPEDDTPKVRRYPCFATGCPMPGTMWASGESTDKPGTCAWHYGVAPPNIPRVTATLQQWACLTFEVAEARRVLTGELRSNPAAVKAAFEAAWDRLSDQVGNWAEVLKPSTIRHRDKAAEGGFRDSGTSEGYVEWARRMEAFVGLQVVESLKLHDQRRAA